MLPLVLEPPFWRWLVERGCHVRRERQELDRLPTEIDSLSAAKASLEKKLTSLSQQGKDSYQQAADIGVQLASLDVDIDAKTDRWLDLEDRAE